MVTPAKLWFKHAQVALDAGYPETAITSVVPHFQEAGRQDYAPALTMLRAGDRPCLYPTDSKGEWWGIKTGTNSKSPSADRATEWGVTAYQSVTG